MTREFEELEELCVMAQLKLRKALECKRLADRAHGIALNRYSQVLTQMDELRSKMWAANARKQMEEREC